MSEREIEVIGRLFEAFNSGGVEATVELLHPDVVFNEPPVQPDASSFRGREAVVEGFGRWWDRNKALGARGMSENSELVRRWFRGLERAELGLDLCDHAIEIRNWAEFPITGPDRGHEGVRRWWDDIGDAFENLDWELLDVVDAGDERVVTAQARSRGGERRSGAARPDGEGDPQAGRACVIERRSPSATASAS